MKNSILTILVSVFMSAISQEKTFTLKSKDLGGQMTNKQFGNAMGCKGENISSELHWENAPLETTGFAVSIYDLDAPTGCGFWHWSVYDIPAEITSLIADAEKRYLNWKEQSNQHKPFPNRHLYAIGTKKQVHGVAEGSHRSISHLLYKVNRRTKNLQLLQIHRTLRQPFIVFESL